MTHCRRPPFPRCGGFTLVEVLVALLVLSIGLLGLAALQTTSLRFNTSAYYRTQATMLAYDLADRMRANRRATLDNEYNFDELAATPDCGAVPDGATVPEQEIADWRNAVACRIPQGTGAVTRAGDEFTFTVQWDDSRGEEDPIQFEFTTTL